MGIPNVLEHLGVELAKKKAETTRMAGWLRAKKLAIKWKKKEIQRIKREKELTIAVNRRLEKLVDDFLAAAETENPDLETAKIWTEKAMSEVIDGMNDLKF